jgi:hypothetical protein
MTASEADSARPRFVPGEHVHHVQARHAFEDREAWSLAALVRAADGEIEVELDGGVRRRYRCRFADDLARVAEELPVARAGGRVTVIVAEQWSLLALPVGEPGGQPPTRLDLATNVARIEGGAAVEVPARSGGGVRLFSIACDD